MVVAVVVMLGVLHLLTFCVPMLLCSNRKPREPVRPTGLIDDYLRFSLRVRLPPRRLPDGHDVGLAFFIRNSREDQLRHHTLLRVREGLPADGVSPPCVDTIMMHQCRQEAVVGAWHHVPC